MCPSSLFLLTLAWLYVHRPHSIYAFPGWWNCFQLFPTTRNAGWQGVCTPLLDQCGNSVGSVPRSTLLGHRGHRDFTQTKTPRYSAEWRHWSASPPAVSLSGLSICCQPHGSRVITHYYFTFTFLIINEFKYVSCFLGIWVSLFYKLPAPIFSLFFYWRVGFFLFIFF